MKSQLKQIKELKQNKDQYAPITKAILLSVGPLRSVPASTVQLAGFMTVCQMFERNSGTSIEKVVAEPNLDALDREVYALLGYRVLDFDASTRNGVDWSHNAAAAETDETTVVMECCAHNRLLKEFIEKKPAAGLGNALEYTVEHIVDPKGHFGPTIQRFVRDLWGGEPDSLIAFLEACERSSIKAPLGEEWEVYRRRTPLVWEKEEVAQEAKSESSKTTNQEAKSEDNKTRK